MRVFMQFQCGMVESLQIVFFLLLQEGNCDCFNENYINIHGAILHPRIVHPQSQ